MNLVHPLFTVNAFKFFLFYLVVGLEIWNGGQYLLFGT